MAFLRPINSKNIIIPEAGHLIAQEAPKPMGTSNSSSRSLAKQPPHLHHSPRHPEAPSRPVCLPASSSVETVGADAHTTFIFNHNDTAAIDRIQGLGGWGIMMLSMYIHHMLEHKYTCVSLGRHSGRRKASSENRCGTAHQSIYKTRKCWLRR